MQAGNGFIRQDCNTRAFQKGLDPPACLLQQARDNHHVIGAIPEGHMYGAFHHFHSNTSGRVLSASSILSTISSIEACPSDFTVKSAFE